MSDHQPHPVQGWAKEWALYNHSFEILFTAISIKLQAMIHPLCRKTFLVPFLQLAFFAMAFGTTLTRLTDNKHHPADLLVGAVIGMAMQVRLTILLTRLNVFEEEEFSQIMWKYYKLGKSATNV